MTDNQLTFPQNPAPIFLRDEDCPPDETYCIGDCKVCWMGWWEREKQIE